MFHSIIPWELVNQDAEMIRAPEEITYRGMQMQVEFLTGSRARIVRLLSPDPAPYLDPQLAPGTEIRLWPMPEEQP